MQVGVPAAPFLIQPPDNDVNHQLLTSPVEGAVDRAEGVTRTMEFLTPHQNSAWTLLLVVPAEPWEEGVSGLKERVIAVWKTMAPRLGRFSYS